MTPNATLDSAAEQCSSDTADDEELRNRQRVLIVVESGSLALLCGAIKGKPLRGGCVHASDSESRNRQRIRFEA